MTKKRRNIVLTDENGDAIAHYENLTDKEALDLGRLKALDGRPEIIEVYAFIGSFQCTDRQEDAAPPLI